MPERTKNLASSHSTTKEPLPGVVAEIFNFHATLNAVYGDGFSRDNPAIVAAFMQAAATQATANALEGLRETLASGTGAITVGVEKAGV